MYDRYLLNVLCSWLEEERANIREQLANLEKNYIKKVPNDFEIGKSIEEKNRELALISENSVEKYKAFWATLGHHDRRPCPSCFCRQGRFSPLIPLSESGGFEWVKCEFCKEKFPIPIDK